MTLTELFFGIALALSLAFGICFIILFIAFASLSR